MSKTEDLDAAGVLDTRTLSATDRQKIDALSTEEVNQLIALFNKLGDMRVEGGGSPWVL